MKTAYRCLFLIAAMGMLLISTTPARADTATEAGKYVSGLADQTLKTISNTHVNKSQKQKKLDRLFSENVDFAWVGRFVMGHYWHEATEAQKTRYLKEYQKFLILHYTSRFTEYTSGDFKVMATEDDGDNEFTVSMQIRPGSGAQSGDQPIMVDYRVRREDGRFKIFDVIVEGVSMITTQRSEFAAVIDKGGIDYLINQLALHSKTGDLNLADGKGNR